ncbi:hypothetical protein J3458_000534 [Metarhizium acridum]|uniref:uncharacterized protein n=1 Tax=Metarhizium acridum TaxID=92637 RepID=UPI001C6CD182|nr:hypothetical protein J3458_000534 [Metarhizium acridum]
MVAAGNYGPLTPVKRLRIVIPKRKRELEQQQQQAVPPAVTSQDDDSYSDTSSDERGTMSDISEISDCAFLMDMDPSEDLAQEKTKERSLRVAKKSTQQTREKPVQSASGDSTIENGAASKRRNLIRRAEKLAQISPQDSELCELGGNPRGRFQAATHEACRHGILARGAGCYCGKRIG